MTDKCALHGAHRRIKGAPQPKLVGLSWPGVAGEAILPCTLHNWAVKGVLTHRTSVQEPAKDLVGGWQVQPVDGISC
jgi:hypothetical protein